MFLDVTNPSDYQLLDSVFIEVNGQLTPFFVESIKLKNPPFAAVKFEGVNSDNDAKIIERKQLYLPLNLLPDLQGNDFYDHEVVGFKVVDSNYGEVGVLESMIDLYRNPLIQVFNGEKEVLIPFRKEMVIKVDRENKEFHITAPEGLIEIYLNDL